MGLLSWLFGKGSSEPQVVEEQIDWSSYWGDVELKAEHSVTTSEGLSFKECLSYFKNILETEFPEYTTRAAVPVEDVVGPLNEEFKLYETRPYQAYKAEWGAPYSFVMYKDGKVAAIIMVTEKWCHNKHAKQLISKMYAKKLDVPYIQFYTQFENNVRYVVSRLLKHL
jgi:hypothetical protein